jgi:hypothetical protein
VSPVVAFTKYGKLSVLFEREAAGLAHPIPTKKATMVAELRICILNNWEVVEINLKTSFTGEKYSQKV